MKYILSFLLFFVCVACGGDADKESVLSVFKLEHIFVGELQNREEFTDVAPDAAVVLEFSGEVDGATINNSILLKKDGEPVPFQYVLETEKKIRLVPDAPFSSFSSYKLTVNPSLKSKQGAPLATGKVYVIRIGMDRTDKFDRIPDDELLTLVQRNTFNYFWKLGHETSGMARERNTSQNTVTTGGTGFGVMATLVAIERGFITRQEGLERIARIAYFLDTQCTKYHGAFSHWIDGETGDTQPFSAKDNGADIVETALLFEGLLAARAYFDCEEAGENSLRETITRMWEDIDWTWFQRGGENQLYWHWSPDYNWEMNHAVTGWNECLIVYILAASSPTYPIDKTVYDVGWAKGGAIRNGNSFYGYTLPLGVDKGGPLFLSQYSFLGIDPRGLKDAYADYWEQNRNHSLINYSHCVENPNEYGGYSADCWGLTACDGDKGYNAYSPTNDKGVIAPTAALSAFPYTPEESMRALHFFYYKLGDKIWTEYGFVDAFNLSAQWYDNQYIAIDQGPIVVMIENYRTGFIWDLFMSILEIKVGLAKLGFQSSNI